MKVIGITGGVGSGKTQVLDYLNDKYGASVCQADEVAKKLQKRGGPCFNEIVDHFGESILDPKGEIDRLRLSDLVFSDEKELAILNGIVHPAVREEIQRRVKAERRKNTSLFLLEAALLIESNYGEDCDEMWYIYVENDIRRKRLVYARGYNEAKVESIMAAQLPKAEFLKNSDRVIDNSGIFEETKIQLDEAVKNLLQ